jgi:hypothetical protein
MAREGQILERENPFIKLTINDIFRRVNRRLSFVNAAAGLSR